MNFLQKCLHHMFRPSCKKNRVIIVPASSGNHVTEAVKNHWNNTEMYQCEVRQMASAVRFKACEVLACVETWLLVVFLRLSPHSQAELTGFTVLYFQAEINCDEPWIPSPPPQAWIPALQTSLLFSFYWDTNPGFVSGIRVMPNAIRWMRRSFNTVTSDGAEISVPGRLEVSSTVHTNCCKAAFNMSVIPTVQLCEECTRYSTADDR